MGGRTPIPVHARVIADTNRDLIGIVDAGTFRADLYYRLARLIIWVHGIAERGGDLDEIAQWLWRDKIVGSPEAVLPPEILDALRGYGLRGGVRELAALLEMLYAEHDEAAPSLRQLLDTWRARGDGPLRSQQPSAAPTPAPGPEPGSLELLREQVERFERERGRYERLTELLRAILERVAEQAASIASARRRSPRPAAAKCRARRSGSGPRSRCAPCSSTRGHT